MNLKNKYGLDTIEANFIKKCVIRNPIASNTLDDLLINNNFTCCCCLGQKGQSIIIHHIDPYETTQDNSYQNLAVLCPVCHDLAHSQRALTLTISKEQIRKAKTVWEDNCINKRSLFLKQPSIKSWQSKFHFSIGRDRLNYLFDLSLSKDGQVINGNFSVIYLDRGNVFMAGEFMHLETQLKVDIDMYYWEMQWGIRSSDKIKGRVMLNYLSEHIIVWLTNDDLMEVVPKNLELRLAT